MLNDVERVELEGYRQQEKRDLVWARIIVATLVAFCGAAYQADAFIDGGVDIIQMARYYSKK